MTLASHAEVATDAADRYAKQLASHLGRRLLVVEEPGGTRIVMDAADCLMTSHDHHLELRCTAADAGALDQVEDVVGRHLARFGARAELVVTWVRA